MWAHTTTLYPTGKQLSGPRVYQGRPPPPPHNTNNHCVSRRNHCVGQFLCKNLLENNCLGPHVYKGFPYNTTHITTVWAHTTTVWADETTVWVNSPVKTLLENNFQGSTFIKGSPYNIPHITTVCAHTITVYTTGKQLSGLHVYKGFPSIKNTHNHCVGTHNHSVPYWKTTFRAPCLPGPPPSSSSQHKQPLCEQTKPLCGSIPL